MKMTTESKRAHAANQGKTEVGSIVTFGRYPQTGSGKDQTPIKWQVLEVKDGKALLISDKALDCNRYNTVYENVTWETCMLRKWLNREFLNTAFSAEEQVQIQKTKVTADKNPVYSTNPGNASTDQVFLLSINEVNRYFTSDEARQCAPTAYAKAQGAWTSDDYKTAGGEAACYWWLRSPGHAQDSAAYVNIDGSVYSYGIGVVSVYDCVRPALWIDLESEKAVDQDLFEQSTKLKLTTESKRANAANQGKTEVGSIVTFGRYPQTGSGMDQTPINWQVLEVKDGKALLISDKALDCKRYNTKWREVTWETCTLQKWLNSEFLNTAFSAEEQVQIQKTKVTADKNPDWDTDPGNATTAQVFLLSIREVNRYFTSDEARQCAPTAYAKAQGAWTSVSDGCKTAGGEAACWWWLRSPGSIQDCAASVFSGGSVYSAGFTVGNDGGCVRPALWIDLES